MNTVIDNLKLNKIEVLDLRYKNINIETIAKMLSINTSLHELYLNNTNIRNEGVVEIAKSLSSNTSLHTLELNRNRIEEVTEIIKLLDSNYSLTRSLFRTIYLIS